MIVSHAASVRILMHMQGAKPRLGRKLPRQIFPHAISREYEKRLIGIADVMAGSFSELVHELPSLLRSAAADHPTRNDSIRLDAGEGKRVRDLVAAAKKKMQTSILTPQLETLADEFARRTTAAQRIQLARQTKAALGVDVFASDAKLPGLIDTFITNNVARISNLTDELSGRVENSVLQAIQTATPWSDYAQTLQDQFGFAENRSRIIARDQLCKLYGQTNATRQRELGVSKFVWRTSEDERVRPEHEELDGNTYAYDSPPSEGLPGEPVLCRCSAEPDFSTILDG